MNNKQMQIAHVTGMLGGMKKWLMPISGRVHYSGIAASLFLDSLTVDGGSAGFSKVWQTAAFRETCLQFGRLSQFKASINQVGNPGKIKVKQFRLNGTTFDFVAESAVLTPTGTGTQTFDLANPFIVIPGDYIDFWMEGNTSLNRTKVGIRSDTGWEGFVRADGDVVTTSPFTDASVISYRLSVEGLGPSPYFATTGDSVSYGYAGWHDYRDITIKGPSGDINYCPAYQLRKLFSNSNPDGFEYQNHGRNGVTLADVVSTGLPAALACGAKTILIHCGINDINTSVTWATFSSGLDSIKTLFAAGSATKLLIDEILPSTGDDTQAASIRTFNANIASWVSSNNNVAGKSIVLVPCHDEMAQIRVSTGMLDDYKTDYADAGNVHPNVLGNTVLASIWKRYL